MTGTATPAFVRQDLVAPRPAPVVTTGIVGFVRTRLLNSPANIALTLASLAVLWITLVPAIRFLLVDAVWQGSSRDACLADNAGHPVGACWPFIAAKFDQLIYGFYPAGERWRVNLAFLIAALLLVPLLMPKVPGKALNAILFFAAFPFLAFFLLYGGGIRGVGVTWTADGAAAVADSLAAVAAQLNQAGASDGLAHLVPAGAGGLLSLLAYGLAVAIRPLVALRDLIRSSPHAVWLDLGVTALVVSVALFVGNGALRTGWRALAVSLASFAGVAVAIAVMGLDRGGLPVVDTRQWGGLLVTLVVSVTGIVASMPVGIALALGRRASLPLIRIGSVIFIEFWRGVPLITVLFFATYMLPLFLPGNVTVDGLVRVLIGVALFSGAYNAEVIRGGLQAIPRGQAEAASALGLSYWKTTSLVVLPQALRHVIPGLVNSFIALFKDTTLVLIVAIFDLLGSLRAAFSDPAWATPTTLFTGFAFTGLIYFVFCFGMSRYSLFTEHRLNPNRRT
ncbi:MAG: amino acid ABC transporter permease [Xanthobacteraceae bacterium]|nr:amino acid ABC transporter permease [Xanthobacteraceae bacterium]